MSRFLREMQVDQRRPYWICVVLHRILRSDGAVDCHETVCFRRPSRARGRRASAWEKGGFDDRSFDDGVLILSVQKFQLCGSRIRRRG